ncbi:restriction endonuclease subunit S [Hoeflea sp.]|uniref:restriction endonuclease subunit S n=1 Tax=Hoeflea sp. TaxID=1940281 RepID=UPI003A9599DB
MSWPMVAVGDAFDFVRNGKSVKQSKNIDGLPITRIETIADRTVDPSRVGYAGLELEGNEQWLLVKGDILFSHINSVDHIGKCAIYEGVPERLIHGMNLLALRPGKFLYPKFAYYALSHDTFRARLLPFVNKAVNQASVSTTNLKTLQIPLPPLDEQKRIAAVLDKADQLRQRRRQAIALLDSLTQSIFLEMFGDPRRSDSSFRKASLKNLGTVSTGKTPPTAKEENFGTDIPFITPGDLELGKKAKRYLSTDGAEFSKVVTKGAALVCCIGATIGKMDIARSRCAFNQQINAVEWNKDVLPLFGLQALRFVKDEIIARSISTTLPILKKSEFEKIEILVPSLVEQREFSDRVIASNLVSSKMLRELLELEGLFLSLQHRAFTGQL